MRIFVAIELPDELRSILSGLKLLFGAPAEAAKWVAPELMHVTLRFLGEISNDQLRSVEKAVRAATAAIGPFNLEAGLPGAFPNERNPRVLWVGLEGESGLDSLRRLYDNLELRLLESGFPREEKRFSPHITVARMRERAGVETRRTLGQALVNVRSQLTGASRTFPVEQLTIMRSDLGPGGPRYTPLSHVSLRGPGAKIVNRKSELHSEAK